MLEDKTMSPVNAGRLERVVSALLLEAANDGIGRYPKSVVRADGTTEERAPWQEGWNAYATQLTDTWDHLLTWWESLPREQKNALAELLQAEAGLYFRAEKGSAPVPWLLMNDTFAYACADGEDLPLEDLPVVLQLWRSFNWSGLVAWAARRRGVEPIGPHRGERYQAAARYLSANDPHQRETMALTEPARLADAGPVGASELRCWCQTCNLMTRSVLTRSMRMVVCPTCGDKRCIHAVSHEAPCAKADLYEHNAWVERLILRSQRAPENTRPDEVSVVALGAREVPSKRSD